MKTVTTIFTKEKVKNAEGIEEEVFVAVPLAELDVREHPEHKKVLEEAIKTRQKAKAKLEAAQKAVEDDEQEVDTDGDSSGEQSQAKAKPTKITKPAVTEPHIPTVDEIIAEMENRRKTEQNKQDQDTVTRKTAIDAALAKHNLPASARGMLEQSLDPDRMAEAVAKAPLSFASNPSGGLEEGELEAALKRVDSKLFGDK